MNKNLTLLQTTWQQHKKELSKIRREVFIKEQNVPETLEWDEFDKEAIHILVFDENQKPIATGRLKIDGQIGRMAVIKSQRKQGIGSAVLKALLQHSQQHAFPKPFLHAQLSAVNFYKKHGLVEYGHEFMDANIPHRSMRFKKET